MFISFRRRLRAFLHGMDVARRVILSAVFWIIVVIAVIAAAGSYSRTAVRKGSILLLQPWGNLVDAYSDPVTYRGLPVGYSDETLLTDMTDALKIAATDDRIAGVWIRLDDLYYTGPALAGEFADAVEEFKSSGKPVIATSDTYDTGRYRMASTADRIVVDRLGDVFPEGYGFWRAYYAEGLDKLGAEAHLFRSGESKTGAENFVLDGMSEAGRRDEERLLGDLWDIWMDEVTDGRGIRGDRLEDWVANYDVKIRDAGGNGSLTAQTVGLVDEVETGGVVRGILDAEFGPDAPWVDSADYLARRYRRPGGGTVAVVPVTGTLVYGEGSTGTAGSADVVESIRAARETPGVQALVVRIDSPGGDVRAGEEIRRCLEETRRDWDFPVVASMGNLAASGGYWIAVESDWIVTRPETITGSIGVYSLALSFREALEKWLGIRIDGVGTTPWSGSGHPGRDMDDRTASIYESGVRDIDVLFRELVAEERGLTPEEVDELAGGIPWSGRRSVGLGLADAEGSLSDAGEKAAELAGLEEWEFLYFDRYIDPRQQMMGRLLWGVSVRRGSSRKYGLPDILRYRRNQVANQ